MPLVVPALRFFVVFLNVYETFKTLKPPPPSARRGGQPSPRAISQRKRELKGCLAVWVVWCCYAVYERTFDRVVGVFLPFYSEIKSVFLLFLVLTRAKGAEPLFLHVLRPLVKPYTVVVDPMLELSRDIGDFLFALLQVPLDYVLSSPWLSSRCTGKPNEEPGDESSHSSSADSRNPTRARNTSRIPVIADSSGPARTSRVLNGRHEYIRSVSDNQHLNGRPFVDNPARSRASHNRHSSTASLPAYSEHPPHDPPRYSQTLSRHSGHQIWYPPASTYPTSGYEMPISTLDPIGIASEYHSPEWRTYPAFPSAYPPTPLPASASLPNPLAMRSGDRRLVSETAHLPIPEDEQGFGKMLERAHEGYPGPVHSSSNSNKMPPGVNSCEEYSDVTRQPDDTLLDDSMWSSDAGLSEDDFGASLKTPHRFPESMPSSGYSSVDSLTSPLTTAHNAFSLRTKTSTESEGSESSLAGRKRTHEAYQGKARSTLPTSHSRNATLRGKPATFPIPRNPPQSTTSEVEGESEADDDVGTKCKRQKVLDPVRRKSTVRPATRGLGNGNAHKGASLSKSAAVPSHTVTTVSQGTARTTIASVTTVNSAVRGRRPTPTTRQVTRSGPQGIHKSSSTSSSQAGALEGRVY